MRHYSPIIFIRCALVALLTLVGCAKQDNADQATTSAAAAGSHATTQPPVAANSSQEQNATSAASHFPTINGVSIARITVGNRLGPDNSALAVPTLVKKEPIILSVQFAGSGSQIQLGAKLTYQGEQLVGQQNTQLESVQSGQVTNVQFDKSDGWPQGHYAPTLTMNDQPVGPAQLIEVQ